MSAVDKRPYFRGHPLYSVSASFHEESPRRSRPTEIELPLWWGAHGWKDTVKGKKKTFVWQSVKESPVAWNHIEQRERLRRWRNEWCDTVEVPVRLAPFLLLECCRIRRMSQALDCPQTLRLQSAQCGMTTTLRSSLLELHNKPTWNPPVHTVGRWHLSPCKTASLIMEEHQRGLATTIRTLRKPHLHPTQCGPRWRPDIRSNFLQPVRWILCLWYLLSVSWCVSL